MTFEEYDRWGNRRKQCGTGGAPTMNPTVGTNHRATARRTDSCADAQSDDGVRRGGESDVGAGGGRTGIPACPRRVSKDPEGREPSESPGRPAGSPSSRLGEGRRAVKASGAGTRIVIERPSAA
jgi:hypothetical protein